MPSINSLNEVYETCFRAISKIGNPPKAEKLELVHTKAWRPSLVSFLRSSLYYVTFIDDSTKKVCVYFLKKKSKVCDVFKKWKSMVENKMGLKVKQLKSDDGGEYKDEKLKEFCSTNGIKLEKIVPKTPQQNGVVECLNRTLNEHVRSMRIHTVLPRMRYLVCFVHFMS